MTGNCSVSVVIPVFNRCFSVCRAIESVLKQDYPCHEIIVVDDASTDDVSSVITSRYPGVTVIRNSENRGVSSSRNAGIRVAKHDWIAFLDSDDEWKKEKIRCQIQKLGRTGHLVCHTDEIWFRRGEHLNQKKKHRKMGGDIFLNTLPLCIISPSSILLHKQVFNEIGLFDEEYEVCEDYEFWLRLTLNYAVDFIEMPLTIKHGGHSCQLSRKHFGMDRWRIRALIKTLDHFQSRMTDHQILEVKREIHRKSLIYANGAGKRGKDEESSFYTGIAEEYRI